MQKRCFFLLLPKIEKVHVEHPCTDMEHEQSGSFGAVAAENRSCHCFSVGEIASGLLLIRVFDPEPPLKKEHYIHT